MVILMSYNCLNCLIFGCVAMHSSSEISKIFLLLLVIVSFLFVNDCRYLWYLLRYDIHVIEIVIFQNWWWLLVLMVRELQILDLLLYWRVLIKFIFETESSMAFFITLQYYFWGNKQILFILLLRIGIESFPVKFILV